jgi:tetratricopeptide (TPR) repeat protein
VNTVDYEQALRHQTAGERSHGLSQPEFAAIMDQQGAWVSQPARGAQPPGGPLPMKTSADARELPLSELAASEPVQTRKQRRTPAADGLRLLLAGAHSLRAMLGESHAPALGGMRSTTERACALARSGDYDELAAVLGELLPGLEAAVRTVPAALQEDTYELTAMAYQACSTALMKLGEPLAAWVAADRAMAAAEQAGNLLLAAAGQYRLASVFLDAHEYALADEMARTTLSALRGLAELGDPDALSLCGGLTLLCALIAARTNHSAAAFGHLAKARLLASRLGSRQGTGMPEFNAQYVALLEIAISIDLGDAGHALRTAASVDLTSLTPGRLSGLLIDVARAYALREQVDEATAALLRAADLGPPQFRDRERAGHVIRDLMTMHNPPRRALLSLAERMGAAPV